MNPKAALGQFQDEIEKGAKRQFKLTAQATKQQFVSQKQQSQSGAQGAGTNEQGGHQQQQGQNPQQQDQFTKEFIQDMYAPTSGQQAHGFSPSDPSGKQPSQFFKAQMQQGKSPEEAQKLESLRKRLHDEVYYLPLTQRKQQQQEERPTEKVEREKMEDLQLEDQKKKDAPPPLAVQMAKNKAEQFPGVSG